MKSADVKRVIEPQSPIFIKKKQARNDELKDESKPY
jgi:hypothetical protein